MGLPWSLWLLPDREDRIKYQMLIDKFSSIESGEPFEPHVTLFGRVNVEPENLFPFFDDMVSVQGKITAKIKGMATGDPPWRSLYVELDGSGDLEAFQKRITKPLCQIREYDFRPHLSLAYGDIIPEKYNIEDVSLDVTIGFSSVVLAYVPDQIDQWSLMKEFKFNFCH